MKALQIKQLKKSYKNGTEALKGVDLEVDEGDFFALLGPNGAGKTTSFYTIAGFIRPNSGRVILDNEDITSLPIHRRALKGISYLAQEPSVFKKLTVEDNVRIVLEPLGLSKCKITNPIEGLLKDMKIQ